VASSQHTSSPGSAAALREELGGGRLLLTDAKIALLMADEARHRTLHRLFGLSRQEANLATFIALLALAQAAQDGIEWLTRPGATPTLADGVIGVSLLRDLLSRAAGPSYRDTPLLGTLITVAFLGAGARQVAQKTGHAARAGTRRADVGFRERYGYLVDPGHWRQRRFERRVAVANERPADSTG
jgi:hypothetical protein